ncbi:MAG: TonB family protein [bacterium]
MIVRRKDPKADLRLQYPKILEIALAISLLLLTLIFISSKEFEISAKQTRAEEVIIKVEDIPITHQIKRPPPPARPTIPIETDEEDIADDLTIEDTEWDISDEPPPPPPSSAGDDIVDFFAIEEKPELVGGAQAIYDYIQKNNLFPSMARQAGVGGVCIIQFVVDETGKPTSIEVFQERPEGLGFGEAGKRAIAAMQFKPGKQRDRFVKVRMQQVIRFQVN